MLGFFVIQILCAHILPVFEIQPGAFLKGNESEVFFHCPTL